MSTPAKSSSLTKKPQKNSVGGTPASFSPANSKGFKILTGPTASTKADHSIRSRVLINPNDLKILDVNAGDAVWIERVDEEGHADGGAETLRKFICNISTLTSVKAGTCMLSQEALEEAQGWAKLMILKVDFENNGEVDDAAEVFVEGPALDEIGEWKKPLANYVLSRVDKCVVSSGTRIGILLGGNLRVVRIAKVVGSSSSEHESSQLFGGCVRIILRKTQITPMNKIRQELEGSNLRNDISVPFAGLDRELQTLLGLMRQCFEHRVEPTSPSSTGDSTQVNPSVFKAVRGALLYGPPGTGKTLLARNAVEQIENCVLVEVEDEATAVETISSAFRAGSQGHRPIVLLFDEMDVMCANNREIVSTLLTCTDMDMSKTFLLACTNHPDTLEPALRRPGRLDEEIEIAPPSVSQRSAILKAHLSRYPNEPGNEDELNKFASTLHGFVGADIMLLCTEAAYLCVERSDKGITMAHLGEALKRVQPSCLREVQVTVPQVRWEDIGGMDLVKQAVREAVELPLKHPESFQRLGIRPPQGVLLYGPPGCSKTLLAKAVATESEMNFIAVKGPELLSKWVGDSEKAIKATFRRANQSKPCVVFLDEIDALAPTRESSGGGVSHRVTSQLLQELDGIQPRSGVVVLCATNRPDLLDPALLRPGRIDRLVYVPPPDLKARIEILKISLRKIPHDFSNEELVNIDTEGFSGAEVASICREAVLKALERDVNVQHITLEDVKSAARRVVPQITKDVIAFYNRFREDGMRNTNNE